MLKTRRNVPKVRLNEYAEPWLEWAQENPDRQEDPGRSTEGTAGDS